MSENNNKNELKIKYNEVKNKDSVSNKEYKIEFSKKLNYYMKLNHKTQADIVNDLGISTSTISTWCRGKKLPRANIIQLLADYFKIDITDLLGNRPEPNQPTSVTVQQQMLIDLVCTLNDEQCEALRNLIAQIRLGD